MSARTLQRVVVRMLFDPALVQAVQVDADRALEGLDLTAAERTWLRAVDPRRWRADPYRRARGLRSLFAELSVSMAAVVRSHGVTALDAFFSSDAFHTCIQTRGSLVGAAAAWLADTWPAVAPWAQLEGAIARVRRAPRIVAPGPRLGAAPWVMGVVVPADTVTRWSTARAALGADPAAAALQADLPMPSPPTEPDVAFLVERGADGPAIAETSAEMVALLATLRTPQALVDVHAALGRMGVDAAAQAAVAADLVADGLLVRRP